MSFNRAQIESTLQGLQLEQPRLYDALKAMLSGLDQVISDVEGNTDGVGSVDTLLSSGKPGAYLQTNVNPSGIRDSRLPVIWADPYSLFDFIEDYLTDTSRLIDVFTGSGAEASIGGVGPQGIGAIRLSTGATNNSFSKQQLTVSNTAVKIDPTFLSYSCYRIKFVTNTNERVVFGCVQDAGNFPTGGTDGAYFRLDTAVDTQLRFVCRSASTETATVVHTPTTGTWYKYEVFAEANQFRIYVDGLFVIAVSTNIPSIGTMPWVTGIQNTTAADRQLDVDYIRLLIAGMTR